MSCCLLKGDDKRAALSLFSENPLHAIARAGCEGLVNMRVIADDPIAPTAAIAVLERFGVGFAAGSADRGAELLETLRGWHAWFELNDPPADWYPHLAAWSKKSHATVRYAFESDRKAFPVEKLRALATPPEGCTLRLYDEALLRQALTAPWSEDQQGAFITPGDFLGRGMGVALLDGEGALLSGCTSFCRHADGFEIQVDTHPDHRGKGYASCVSAAFILEALGRGMTPCWDAANATSFRLAEKLGFVFTRAYPAWILVTEKETEETIAQKVIGS